MNDAPTSGSNKQRTRPVQINAGAAAASKAREGSFIAATDKAVIKTTAVSSENQAEPKTRPEFRIDDA